MNGKRQKTRLNKEQNSPRVLVEFNEPGDSTQAPLSPTAKSPHLPSYRGGRADFFLIWVVYTHTSQSIKYECPK
tara:strand:+ start:222 stop:443 length:222 start_codon:yes stop_codon:yes gene_type:complete